MSVDSGKASDGRDGRYTLRLPKPESERRGYPLRDPPKAEKAMIGGEAAITP